MALKRGTNPTRIVPTVGSIHKNDGRPRPITDRVGTISIMPIPKFLWSTRRLMIAIGVFGLLLGGGIIELGRRRDYQERSNYYLQQLEGCPPSPSRGFFFQLPHETQREQIKSWVHHARMWERYQTALKIPFYFLPDEAPE